MFMLLYSILNFGHTNGNILKLMALADGILVTYLFILRTLETM